MKLPRSPAVNLGRRNLISQSVTPTHVKPLKVAKRLFRELPNTEGNGQPDQDHVYKQP